MNRSHQKLNRYVKSFIYSWLIQASLATTNTIATSTKKTKTKMHLSIISSRPIPTIIDRSFAWSTFKKNKHIYKQMCGNNSHYDPNTCRIYDPCLLPLSTLCTPSQSSTHTCHK